MYQTIEIRVMIRVVAIVGVIIFAFISWYAPPDDSWVAWAKHVSAAAAATAITIGAFGNKWVFPRIWRKQLIQSLSFPYIAGEWVGTISSNWPVVDLMRKAFLEGSEPHRESDLHIEKVKPFEKPVKVTIEADLFRVTMRLETTDDYSISHTIAVRPQRNGPLRRPLLYYIYQNDTPIPKETDVANHIGAACLEVCDDGKRLEGTYWTAREWTRGLNTAGRIRLTRAQSLGR